MGLSLTTFSSGTAINASDIRDKIETIENFVNKGIVASDLKDSSAWVESFHIYKPEFYGSPSPRREAVSGDTWHRHAGLGASEFAIFHGDLITEEWIAVPGLASVVRNHSSSDIFADVMVCFYAFTIAGSEDSDYDFNEQTSATFALFNGDTQVVGTRREIFASPNKGILAPDAAPFWITANPAGGGRLTRNNLSMYGRVSIAPGTSNVAVKVNLEPVTYDGGNTDYTSSTERAEPDWKHTFVGARSFIVNAHHLHA